MEVTLERRYTRVILKTQRIRPVLAASLAVAVLAISARAPARAAEPTCQFDNVERIVAVGDVHGAFDQFVEILRAAGILDDKLHWAGGRTHFVQTGDILDRGAGSRKALDLLDHLSEEAGRAGGAVHQLLGNHEVMRLLGDTRYVSPGEYAAFTNAKSMEMREEYLQGLPPTARDQAEKETPLGLIEMRMAFGRNGQYGRSLRKLNTVEKINGVLFLHGGISPAIADMPCDAINATVRRELSADLDKTRSEPLSTLSAREDGPLWYRGLAQEPDAFQPAVDGILQKQNARAIVIGHTVVQEGRIRVRFGGKVFQIDTGMQPAYVATGRASALEIKNGVFTAIYTDRRDVLQNAAQ